LDLITGSYRNIYRILLEHLQEHCGTRLKTDAVRRISNHNGGTRAPIDGAPRPSAIVPPNTDFRVGLLNISCAPTPSSGIPSEGEKRDSKGDMLGYSFRTAKQDEKSTQQRLLCSGASNSDSAEGDLLGPVSWESPAHWVLNAFDCGDAETSWAMGWSRLLRNSYATRRAVLNALRRRSAVGIVHKK